MKPADAKDWIGVGRDIVLIILGSVLILWEVIWGAPPQPLILVAGISLVVGGSRKQIMKVFNGGENGGS